MGRIITLEMMRAFEKYLYSDEKSCDTVEKYIRDVKVFWTFTHGQSISKTLVMEYKNTLADLLGHSNINTTRIYIVATGNEHRRRMENMRLII